MEILNYITSACLLLSSLALLWLVVRAFRRHVGWGVAVLLLSPISATAFGVSYWRDEKIPFLAYITTFATAITLSLYLFTVWGGWDVVRASLQAVQGDATQQTGSQSVLGFIKANLSFTEHGSRDQRQPVAALLAEEQPEIQDDEPEVTEATNQEEIEQVSLNRKVKPKKERYRLVYTPIKVRDAKNYIGATMKVTRKNVKEKEYRLVSATPYSMEFSQRNQYGSFSFKFKNHEIEKIRVLLKEPY